MDTKSNKAALLYKVFGVIGLGLLIATFFLPTWWVALQSRQYPKSMYPKGIRIEFKYDGVYNGCKGVKEREEITTNEGAECLVEMNAINHFIGMHPIVQGVNTDKSRPYPEYYTFDTKKDANGDDLISTETGKPVEINVTPKYLKFLDGVLRNSRYIFILFGLMLIGFIATPKKVNSVLAWIPALVPFYFILLFGYSMYWYGHHLSLHGGGAFSGIKPFMPTIFGEGKVAQFATVSYPYIGFGTAVLTFITVMLSLLLKKKAIRDAK